MDLELKVNQLENENVELRMDLKDAVLQNDELTLRNNTLSQIMDEADNLSSQEKVDKIYRLLMTIEKETIDQNILQDVQKTFAGTKVSDLNPEDENSEVKDLKDKIENLKRDNIKLKREIKSYEDQFLKKYEDLTPEEIENLSVSIF